MVSCWSGTLWHINLKGEKKLLLDTRSTQMNTADIGYDKVKKIVYVPTFWKNSVVAYQLAQQMIGDNPMGAMRTIAAALARVDASTNQPFTVMVNSGTYEEIFPLVIPENVNVVGADIRNVIVTPTAATTDKDAFHLNDKSVVTNLTIKDFNYDSVNNTGYAFRFAPNAVMNERSPYIQDVSVLTNPTSPGGSDEPSPAVFTGRGTNS